MTVVKFGFQSTMIIISFVIYATEVENKAKTLLFKSRLPFEIVMSSK